MKYLIEYRDQDSTTHEAEAIEADTLNEACDLALDGLREWLSKYPPEESTEPFVVSGWVTLTDESGDEVDESARVTITPRALRQ